MTKDKLRQEALTPRRSPRHQKKRDSNGQQQQLTRPVSIYMDMMMETTSTKWDEDLKHEIEQMASDNPAIGDIFNASAREESVAKTRGFWMLSGSVRIRVEVPDEFQDITDDTKISDSKRHVSTQTHSQSYITTSLSAPVKIELD